MRGNRSPGLGVRRAMNVRHLLLGPALMIAVGCQSAGSPVPTSAPSPTATQLPSAAAAPSPTAAGLVGVAADLTSAGVIAKVGSPFSSEPIGGEGIALCVGAETVQTYRFIDHEAAL